MQKENINESSIPFNISKEYLMEKIKEGNSLYNIAKSLNYSVSTLYRDLEKYNLKDFYNSFKLNQIAGLKESARVIAQKQLDNLFNILDKNNKKELSKASLSFIMDILKSDDLKPNIVLDDDTIKKMQDILGVINPNNNSNFIEENENINE